MPLDFPNSPNVNDTFTSNGRSWKWDGTTWDLVPIAHSHPMADLVDFAVSSPASGQALVYNGTKWANSSAIPQASVSGLPASLAGKASLGDIGNADFNTAVTSGMYRFGVPAANGPGLSYGQLLVIHDTGSTDTLAQMAFDFDTSTVRVRTANNWPSATNWRPWRTVWASSMDIGGNYTITAGDSGKTIRSTGGAITVTIANVLNAGDRIDFIQDGAGQITFAASGVTLQSKGAKLKTSAQYAGATIFCVAAGQYRLIGDLA